MEWISVKDRLPDKAIDVLVFDDNERIIVSRYFCLDGQYHWENRDDVMSLGEVLYWMPLPLPPKEQ